MEIKNITNMLIAAILCIVLAVGVSTANSYATEDGVVDNDCVTFSSATRLQLATYNLQKTWDGTMEYSTDKIHWYEWDGGYINSAAGVDGKHYIYVRGDNNHVVSGGTTWALMKPDMDATIDVSGNIETLRGATGNQPSSLQMAEDCYGGMFKGDQWLSSAPDLTATSLAENCYMQMFEECISLKKAPELPAKTLAASCYMYMFRACNSLTETPDLPATTLAENCYSYMFDSCYYIKSAPEELPATSLEPSCYAKMFIDCIRLEKTPALPATDLAESCYEGMFANCSKLKYTVAKLPATVLAPRCYFGMFTCCWELQKAPKLPATELVESCYSEMFLGCRSLTAPVDISHVTTLADNCCYRMYENCINLAVYKKTKTGITKEWKATSATESAEGWDFQMFEGTCGTFTGTPVVGGIYYLADITPTAHTITAADTEGGYVSINDIYCIPGKTVEAEAVPRKGYVTESFIVRDADGVETPIVNNSFIMPDSDVTIIATFKLDIQKCIISGVNESYTYTGLAIEPEITVQDGDTILTQNVDYTIAYKDNINVGTATLTITGKGDYAGTMSRTFTISKAKGGGDVPTDDSGHVATGDYNHVALYGIIGVIALCGAGFVYKRREN